MRQRRWRRPVLVLLTGAGWSADSGLAVSKGVADVDAYRAEGLTYRALCEPHWVDDDPALFYGFWGGCFNGYRDAKEHEGYGIVRRWRDAQFDRSRAARALRARHGGEAGAFFSFTSNVDAHHLRTFRKEEVRECHGNVETWQCADSSCRALDGERGGGPRWAAPAGFRFAVDAETQRADAGARPKGLDGRGSGGDGCASPSGGGPQGGGQRRRVRFADDAAQGEGFVGNHPLCPACGKGLRPSILMFSDSQWIDDPAQKGRWAAWRDAVEAEAWARAHAEGEARPLRVAILEVGAGGNVTTVRQLAEDMLESVQGKGCVATLIRVNPDLPLADARWHQASTISLPCCGLAAVRRIDAELQTLVRHGEAAIRAAESTPVTLATVPEVPRPAAKEVEKAAPKAAPVMAPEVPASTPEQLKKVRAAFDAIDKDGNGTLDRDEVRRAAQELGRWELFGKALDEAMTAMDADGDGRVDFEQFCRWWEAGGKLSACERFDLSWARFNARFDSVISRALDGVAGGDRMLTMAVAGMARAD